MAAPVSDLRTYSARAESTATFGRVLCNAREHHFVVDGPVQNGCPGEAPTPAELFLAGVASCGVELVQVLARRDGIDVGEVRVAIEGEIDRSHPVRPDVSLFNRVRIAFELGGVDREQAERLVERFRET